MPDTGSRPRIPQLWLKPTVNFTSISTAQSHHVRPADETLPRVDRLAAMLCKGKNQYLFTCKVNRYCLSPSQSSADDHLATGASGKAPADCAKDFWIYVCACLEKSLNCVAAIHMRYVVDWSSCNQMYEFQNRFKDPIYIYLQNELYCPFYRCNKKLIWNNNTSWFIIFLNIYLFINSLWNVFIFISVTQYNQPWNGIKHVADNVIYVHACSET